MAMGTRKQREKQEDIWIAHTELASAPGHPFYQRLNELLEGEGFDEFVEGRCAQFAFMLLLLMVPFQLLIIPLYVIIVRNYGLGNSYLGMIAPFAINSTAVFIFRQYFLQVPKELFDAARIDGAGELRVLTRVALPLVPSIR